MLLSGGEHAASVPVFVKVGRKRFQVPPSYVCSLKANQEMCHDMWLVAVKCTLQHLLACLFESMKAMAECSPDITKEVAVFVRVFAPWLQ